MKSTNVGATGEGSETTTNLDEEDGWEGHDSIDNCDPKRNEGTEVGKGLGENVVAVVEYCGCVDQILDYDYSD